MPLLLKPAPTRLRLVLWALSSGLQEFPEAPPPGLVTVPVAKDAPRAMTRCAAIAMLANAPIRIDMLERLADMLRAEDSRGGFEAKPDMLSITGMTLEQFADLMQGLGYNAERGERKKVKPAPQNSLRQKRWNNPRRRRCAPEAATEEARRPRRGGSRGSPPLIGS